jgi:hypothetical protein
LSDIKKVQKQFSANPIFKFLEFMNSKRFITKSAQFNSLPEEGMLMEIFQNLYYCEILMHFPNICQDLTMIINKAFCNEFRNHNFNQISIQATQISSFSRASERMQYIKFAELNLKHFYVMMASYEFYFRTTYPEFIYEHLPTLKPLFSEGNDLKEKGYEIDNTIPFEEHLVTEMTLMLSQYLFLKNDIKRFSKNSFSTDRKKMMEIFRKAFTFYYLMAYAIKKKNKSLLPGFLKKFVNPNHLLVSNVSEGLSLISLRLKILGISIKELIDGGF